MGQKIPEIKILEIPKLKQLRFYCGIACLSMASSYFGRTLEQEVLAEKYFTKGKFIEGAGVSLLEILGAARKIGLNAKMKYGFCDDDIIKSINDDSPIIALAASDKYLMWNHFYLIKGYDTSGFIYINDPGDLRKNKFKYAEFRKLWDYRNNCAGVSVSK